MKKIILLLLSLFLYFSSFAQLVKDSILIENHYRTFYFKKPTKKTNQASLIFILHGSGASGDKIIFRAEKLQEIAEQENILLVYPNGYKNFWNECRKAATSAANLENINENDFFNQLIIYFDSAYQINTNHVFAIGLSGGGHMAYKLAITMPKKIKAITAIVASLPDSTNMDCVESKIPLPVLIINGTSDPVNPYNGGEVKVEGVVLGNVRSTEQTFMYWANLSGYKGKPKKEYLPDVDPSDGKTIEKFTYKEKGKDEVTLLKVINGKHEHPSDIDAYLEAWKFFKRSMSKK